MEEPSMKERINEKIEQIERYLIELEEIKSENFEEYKIDFKTRAACEHYFEKIVEACEDLAFLFLRERKLRFPDKEESVFNILYEDKIISNILNKNLQEAKKMRNKITHWYEEVDDKIVFEAINNELEGDIRKFIKEILSYVENTSSKCEQKR